MRVDVARRLGGVAVAGAAGVLLWPHRAEIAALGRELRAADPAWLAAAGAFLVVWWVAWAALHAGARGLVGIDGWTATGRLVPVTIGAVAMNLAVKSGGLAGLGMFVSDGRRRGVPPGRVAAAYLVATVASEIGFALTLAGAVAMIAAGGALTRMEAVAVAAFAVVLAVRAAIVVVGLRDERTLRRWWTAPARWWDRIRRRPQRPHSTAAVDDLRAGLAALRRRPLGAVPVVATAFAVDAAGAAMLWASVAAVGGGTRPVPALVAYAMSALLGIVGPLPGGLGFVELGAVAVLVSFGVPIAVAGAAAIVFRAWEFWLPLLVGVVAAGLLRGGRPVASTTAAVPR